MSDLDALRALVREVIRDVLPHGLAVTETVNLSTDEDLASFVRRLLDAGPGEREELRSGRKRFTLAAPRAAAGQRLVLGRGAVLTPLARDRARASGVQIEKER